MKMPPISKNMGIMKPFQLLEINVISAQDLEPLSKKMKTYAAAWIHPTRKLATGVDVEGGNNPTWNDKFVFRVDEEFLRQDNSAVHIEIYSVHWFRDSLVGTVRVLVGNLIPPIRTHHRTHHLGMRFVALQVRRPSGRPQGILNIGVALLDGSMRSMPLYRRMSTSAVGYRDLMEEDTHLLRNNEIKQNSTNTTTNNNNISNTNDDDNNNVATLKPILRRTKSERSERVAFDDISMGNSSIVAIPSKTKVKDQDKESSILSISFEPPTHMMRKKGKASSVISEADLIKEKSRIEGKKGKASSVLSDSIVSKGSSIYDRPNNEKPKPKLKLIELEMGPKDEPTSGPPTTKVIDEQSVTKPIMKNSGNEFGGPKGPMQNGKFVYGGPLSESEIGPSASELAAALLVDEKRYPLLDDKKSSVLDGWSLDESTEGLRSKLERWRTELPPVYDRGTGSSSYRSTGRHGRRRSDGGSSLFSCFGNICGYECQCICGKPQKRSHNNKYKSPSTASRSWL
ncbi:uncharacterized protein LOC132043943 [Lycium ferocissimum]|uniref:uncharacterized protein LOC132043943 n=1 Tax=Lycium ferocissimum TaxID=112874 RepID=UPI002815D724|nr:uncharacterized protein LOC132043943 [Lycium ferocissimum]